jgi:hypothetical protein
MSLLLILFSFLINLTLVNYNLLYKYSKESIISNIITFSVCIIIIYVKIDTMEYLLGLIFFPVCTIVIHFFYVYNFR